MKRLWIMIAAVILGGGLTAAVSAPAWAGTNNFVVDWVGINPGSTDFQCNHGQSYPADLTQVLGYHNNCAVRVWVYPPSGGNGQCIDPGKPAVAQFSTIGRIFISTNTAPC